MKFPEKRRTVVVVGAGHNGLIAACYLARVGQNVLVLEQSAQPGGGSITAERIPGYRFDTHSVAHNIINMTNIPKELNLVEAGLEYIEMNPFSVAIRADGKRVRFYRSVKATVASIAESDESEAKEYEAFIKMALPIVRTVIPAIRGETHLSEVPARLLNITRVLSQGPTEVTRNLLSPYDSLLKRWLLSDLTRGPVSAFAAHAGVGPNVPGGAFFALWQAAYHLFGQWHAKGGSGALIEALMRRLVSYGGQVRCCAPVARIEAAGGKVERVLLESGEAIEADAVITAMNPKVALLQLLDPPLEGRAGAGLAAAHTSNGVQALVHVATDRLPPYPDSCPDDYHGLQSYVDTLDEMTQGFIQAEAGHLPDPLPLYAFTTSAIDDTLAPPGHHTVYLACPSAPAKIQGGWEAQRDVFVERCLDVVESRAPGFRASIQGVRAFTPLEMEQAACWPLAHPMYLDITLDQLGPLRPTRRLGHHRTPVEGLYISGAGTNPTGGIAGTPGRLAAQALLHDWRKQK
ncbi:MAG: NAD(P)/FAD-dependent oxidoreductase [Chloroflexota bacterium]|nr:NAD(P)/FAD-dependent oxidoreductase [Chloroflexota bacterium]